MFQQGYLTGDPSVGKIKGKRGNKKKIHRHIDLTKQTWRQWQETNLTTLTN